MTDDLRTRIAAALWDEYDTTMPVLNVAQCERLADAVIRELGLTEESSNDGTGVNARLI